MTNLPDLISRIERGPITRKLNDDVLVACGWKCKILEDEYLRRWYWPDGDTTDEYFQQYDGWDRHDGSYDKPLPSPLDNLQDAVDMVPEGWEWNVSNRAKPPHTGRAWINNRELQLAGISGMRKNPKYRGYELTAATPAAALTIATLKAVAEKEGGK